MKPTSFPQQSTVLNQGQPNELPIHIDHLHGIATVCYQADAVELAAINASGGKVHISFSLNGPIILNVSPTLEMRELTTEERGKLEATAKRQRVMGARDKRNPNRLKKRR